ncbi:MAG: hypothetical protein ACFFDK_19280 [Promethearchaeota archaeon]
MLNNLIGNDKIHKLSVVSREKTNRRNSHFIHMINIIVISIKPSARCIWNDLIFIVSILVMLTSGFMERPVHVLREYLIVSII